MQIYFSSDPFTVSNRVQEVLGRFMVLHKKVCLELGRENFIIFPLASSLCRYQYSQSTVKGKLKEKGNTPSPVFNLFFISVGKSPLDEFLKKNKCILGTCRSGFWNGNFKRSWWRSQMRKWKLWGNWQWETGNQAVIYVLLHHPRLERVQSRVLAWLWVRVLLSGTERREIPSICFLNYHPEDTGGKSQGTKIALEI